MHCVPYEELLHPIRKVLGIQTQRQIQLQDQSYTIDINGRIIIMLPGEGPAEKETY